MRKNGRPYGIGTKLTETQVNEIKDKYSTSQVTLRELAKEYGCAHQTIWGIIKGKYWSRVEPKYYVGG